MKKIIRINASFVLLLMLMTVISACNDDLAVSNENEPTLDAIKTEEGLKRTARGVYESFDLNDPKNFLWIVQVYHETMGDAIVVPWGNWQFRWLAQVTSITLDDGSTWTPPEGGTQPEEVARVNKRQFGDDSAIVQEWGAIYFLNNQANLILETVEAEDLSLSGDQAEKINGYKAWAYWWKGYAYSRIGSMYKQGVIIDNFGETNSDFKDQSEIIAEANRNFDLAIDNAASFDLIASDVVPSLFVDGVFGIPNSASLREAANTMKARNLLVNTFKDELTTADYQQIKGLTENGLFDNTNTLVVTGDAFVTYPEFWMMFSAATIIYGWHRASERLIQDIPSGDNRLSHFTQTTDEDTGNPTSWSTRGRGIEYNSTWGVLGDGFYASILGDDSGLGWYFVSAEENMLMLAEAELELGNKPKAAELVDDVRTMQGAGLPPIDPITTSDDEMWELIRKERRIALFLRGLAFYDARRWKVILPLSEGGGRTGAVVVENDDTINTNATINYNFLPYWPIPDEEITFNRPDGDGVGDVQ